MDKRKANTIALQIANNTLKTEPKGIIKYTNYDSQAAHQVADFIKTLSERLQKNMNSMVVKFG